jgi:hypothetical protein
MDNFSDRVALATRLDPSVYERVTGDESATVQALALIVVVNGLSALVPFLRGDTTLKQALFFGIVSFVAWFGWMGTSYWLGSTVLAVSSRGADWMGFLRATGFASAPGLLRILSLLSLLKGLIAVVSGIWILCAMVVAMRESLRLGSTERAVGVCLIGFAVDIALLLGLGMVGVKLPATSP